jgi:hypothetical protein
MSEKELREAALRIYIMMMEQSQQSPRQLATKAWTRARIFAAAESD